VPNANDQSELILYQAEDGITRIHVRLVDGSVWLTQRQLGDLYQVSVPTVSEHLHNIFAEGELSLEATVRKFRTVRTEGNRTISRTVDHYSLPVVLAVGYRVRSPRGTQFRRWATTRLEEYVIKGFTLDDERLKQPAGADYFDELLERIRDIRASEARVYQRIREIFALAADYVEGQQETLRFFAFMQNKMHQSPPGSPPPRSCAGAPTPTTEHGSDELEQRARAQARRRHCEELSRRERARHPQSDHGDVPRPSRVPSAAPQGHQDGGLVRSARQVLA
jgi:hypothetical protein